GGRLLLPESAIEVAAYAHMLCIPCQLADMVDMVHNSVKHALHTFRCGYASLPSRHHHPGIECYAYYRLSFNKCFYHFVAELPVMIHQGAAIIMAGPNMPIEMLHCLPESIVAKMGRIEYYVQRFHLSQ